MPPYRFLIPVAIMALSITLWFLIREEPVSVIINNYRFSLYVADDPAEQARGLAGRVGIDTDEGMLFLFSDAQERVFWMKDVAFPIDIIWVNDGRVMGIQADVQPQPGVADAALVLYRSPGPVDRVLEFAAGTAARLNITVGSSVVFQ